jgi:hypothetical protein
VALHNQLDIGTTASFVESGSLVERVTSAFLEGTVAALGSKLIAAHDE